MRNPIARLIRQIVGGRGPVYRRAKRLYAKTPSTHKAALLAQLTYQAAIQQAKQQGKAMAKRLRDEATARGDQTLSNLDSL